MKLRYFYLLLLIILPFTANAVYTHVSITASDAMTWGTFYTSTLDMEASMIRVQSSNVSVQIGGSSTFDQVRIYPVIDFDVIAPEPIITESKAISDASSLSLHLPWGEDLNDTGVYAIELLDKGTLKALSFISYKGTPEYYYNNNQVDFYCFYNTKRGTASIIEYAGSQKESVSIPDMVAFETGIIIDNIPVGKGFRVTTVAPYTFANNTELESIEFDGVETIGESAFEGCSSLKYVSFKDNDKSINAQPISRNGRFLSPFYDSPIEEVYIGRSIDVLQNSGEIINWFGGKPTQTLAKAVFGSNMKSVPHYCFYDCKNLKTVELPKDMTTIGTDAFYRCWGLRSITLPPGLTTIYNYAFYDCRSLLGIILPSEIKTIGCGYTTNNSPSSVFSNCNNMEYVVCLYSKEIGSPVVGSNTKVLVPSEADYGWGQDILSLKDSTYIYTSQKITPELQPLYSEEFKSLNNIRYESQSIDIVDAGEYNIPCNINFSWNDYSCKFPLALSLTVNKAELLVKAQNASSEYGNDTAKLAYIVEGWLGNDEVLGFQVNPTITSNVSPLSPVGKYEIQVDGGESKNYNLHYSAGEYTVSAAPLTISCSRYSRKYMEENPQFIPEYDGFRNNEGSQVLETLPTLYTEADENSNVGEYPIVVSNASAKNYRISYIPGTLVIEKADQDILWPGDYEVDVLRGYQEYELEAVSTSGLPVVYSSDNESIASVSGSKLLLHGFGSVNISATQQGNDNYNQALTTTKIFNVCHSVDGLEISKKQINLKVEDSYTLQFETITSPSLIHNVMWYTNDSEIVSVDNNGFVTGLGEGDATIYLDVEGIDGEHASSSCSVYVSKHDQTINWDQNLDDLKVGSVVTLEAEASSGLPIKYEISNGDNFVKILDENQLMISDNGEFSITAIQNGNYKYNPAVPITLYFHLTSGINQVCNDKISIHYYNGNVIVNGKRDNDKVLILLYNGTIIYNGTESHIPISQGLYIIKVGLEVFRIYCK